MTSVFFPVSFAFYSRQLQISPSFLKASCFLGSALAFVVSFCPEAVSRGESGPTSPPVARPRHGSYAARLVFPFLVKNNNACQDSPLDCWFFAGVLRLRRCRVKWSTSNRSTRRRRGELPVLSVWSLGKRESPPTPHTPATARSACWWDCHRCGSLP